MNVPRGVVIALVGALAAALLAVAFLLGRESERRELAAPGAPPRPVAPSLPYEPPAVADAPEAPPAAPAPSVPSQPPHAPPSTPPAPAPAASPSPSPSPSRPTPARAGDAEAVARYFASIDALGPQELGGSQEEMAQRMVGSLTTGDTSSFDALVTSAKESQRKAAAIVPPEPCREYHTRLVALLTESVALLEKVQGSIARKDLDALASLGTSASSVKSRAEALEAEATRLRSQYPNAK